MSEPLRAVLLNCTLKKSPERSHTQGLLDIVIGHMEGLGVECETVRVVDHHIPFGVSSDMGEGDEWPGILAKILDRTDVPFNVHRLGSGNGIRRRDDILCRMV